MTNKNKGNKGAKPATKEPKTVPVVETEADKIVTDADLADALGLDTAELAVATPTPPAEPEKVPEKEPTPVDTVSTVAARTEDEDGTVRNEFGEVLFKRMKSRAKVEAPVAQPRQRQRIQYKANTRMVSGSATNASLLAFPTDRWGITKDLKKAFTHLSSRIAGDEGKKQLVDDTLSVLIQHMEAKYKADSEYRQAKLDAYLEDIAE